MTIKSTLMKGYDVFKKLLDPVDDIVRAVVMTSKDLLPKEGLLLLDFIGDILIGSIGFILHAIEFAKSIYNLCAFFLKKSSNVLKTIFSAYNFILSGTGVGLAVTLIAGTLGAVVAPLALALSPLLIPTLMMFIFINTLIKNCIKLAEFNKSISSSHASDETVINNNMAGISIPTSTPMTPEQSYALHKKQCKVAFNVIECVAAGLIVAGTVSGLFPLIIAGVLLGFISKVVETINQKYDYRFSLAIKNFFTPHKKTPPASTPDAVPPPITPAVAIVKTTHQYLGHHIPIVPSSIIKLTQGNKSTLQTKSRQNDSQQGQTVHSFLTGKQNPLSCTAKKNALIESPSYTPKRLSGTPG